MPRLIRRYIFSTDHKVIGLQYGFTSMFFLLVGFFLVMLIRWQQAFPAQPIPLVGSWLGEANAPGGVLLPEFYNQLGAMHGTIMVFLGVVPLAFGAFGNYVVPLQIGAPDMAFPRLNMTSYWLYLAGGIVMLASFLVPGGRRFSRLNSDFVAPTHLLISINNSRQLLAVLALVLLLVLPEQSAAQASPHLRVLDHALNAVLDRGAAQSPTLQQLIDEIEATRILVFAECAMRLPTGVAGRMNFVTNAHDYRFVRIAIDCTLIEKWQTVLLAHELQHALEIGRNPDVVDVEAMESLYEEIGYPTSRERGTRHFETEAAIAVQRAVESELHGRGTPEQSAY